MKGKKKRIAVVGAGIAGLSTAYYLSKLAQGGGQRLSCLRCRTRRAYRLDLRRRRERRA